jgi:hypothetical protein
MKANIRSVWLVGVLFLLIFGWHSEVRAEVIDQESGVILLHAKVGEQGDWTVVYQIDESGMETGGGLKVQFPASWFVFPWPHMKYVQTSDVDRPHYVTARTSRAGRILHCL